MTLDRLPSTEKIASSYQLVTATGASGHVYEFQVDPLGTKFRPIPGLYVFSRPDAEREWCAVYVGQTHDLQARVGGGLENHHCYLRAQKADVTHIGVSPYPGTEFRRKAAEADLIAALDPPLNRTNPARNAFG